MDYLRSLFGDFCPDEDEVEARCMLAFSLWIGNHFMAADHGARSRADVLELALRRLEAWLTRRRAGRAPSARSRCSRRCCRR